MRFFSEKISMFTVKISDDLFSDFPFLFQDFPYLLLCSVSYMTLSSQEQTTISQQNSVITPFFTLFVLSRASDNTTYQNIGGTDSWADLPPQIWKQTVSPVPSGSPPLVAGNKLNRTK